MDLVEEYNHKLKVFHDIIGCAYDVYNEFRPGLTEYPYQYGLRHLLTKLGYNVQKEYPLPMYLYGERLDESYRLDLVLVRPEEEGSVIIECKAKRSVIEDHRDQLKNYMLLTHCRYGMLINFVKDGDKRVFTETYEYDELTHAVVRKNIKYMGNMYEMTIKPWQSYLDAKKNK